VSELIEAEKFDEIFKGIRAIIKKNFLLVNLACPIVTGKEKPIFEYGLLMW
jgi:hypothetical protein